MCLFVCTYLFLFLCILIFSLQLTQPGLAYIHTQHTQIFCILISLCSSRGPDWHTYKCKHTQIMFCVCVYYFFLMHVCMCILFFLMHIDFSLQLTHPGLAYIHTQHTQILCILIFSLWSCRTCHADRHTYIYKHTQITLRQPVRAPTLSLAYCR
jgi:hypothetical protein